MDRPPGGFYDWTARILSPSIGRGGLWIPGTPIGNGAPGDRLASRRSRTTGVKTPEKTRSEPLETWKGGVQPAAGVGSARERLPLRSSPPSSCPLCPPRTTLQRKARSRRRPLFMAPPDRQAFGTSHKRIQVLFLARLVPDRGGIAPGGTSVEDDGLKPKQRFRVAYASVPEFQGIWGGFINSTFLYCLWLIRYKLVES